MTYNFSSHLRNLNLLCLSFDQAYPSTAQQVLDRVPEDQTADAGSPHLPTAAVFAPSFSQPTTKQYPSRPSKAQPRSR